MVGRIQCRAQRGRSRPQTESLCGLVVLTAGLYAPENVGRELPARRIRTLERLFCRAEIRRVILPDRFPYRERLSLIRPVDPMPLYRATADLLALELLRKKGILLREARAALAGPRLCPELCAAAERLCPTVREVRIDVPGEEGERFARYLHREFGVPVVPRTAAAHAVIAFGQTGGAADLCLWGESGIRLGAEGLSLPEGIDQPLLALLWEQGRVKRESLRVRNLP